MIIYRRTINKKNAIYLPASLMKGINVTPGDQIEMAMGDEAIIIKKVEPKPLDKHAIAMAWLDTYHYDLNVYEAEFSIVDTVVECSAWEHFGPTNKSRKKRLVASAYCSPEDTFDPAIGMVISAGRCLDLPIPDELL